MSDTLARLPAFILSLTAAFALAGCLGTGKTQTASSSGTAAQAAQPASQPALPPADPPQYASHADQFAGLQVSGLRGRYTEFAGHLKAADPAGLSAKLNRYFQGRPFDVYTLDANADAQRHKRLVELRSTSGRLYLMVEMDKVPGGWRVAGYDLSPRKAGLNAQL